MLNRWRIVALGALALALGGCAAELDYAPLQFSVSGERMVAVGVIDGGTLDRFEDALEDHPNVRVLVLQNIGGSVDDDANVQFSRVVNRLGFTTLVPSDGLIASGGTDLFLAGSTRILEPGACVGVHSWAADDFTANDVPRNSPEHDPYLDYYEDIGIDAAFYWFTIDAAPADRMHWMSAREVARFGVTTRAAVSLSGAAECWRR